MALIIERISEGNNLDYKWSHIRAYETPNLLQFGAQIYYQTQPSADFDAVNLINNLESRTGYHA